MSVCPIARIAPYTIPITASVAINGANVFDGSGNNCRQ